MDKSLIKNANWKIEIMTTVVIFICTLVFSAIVFFEKSIINMLNSPEYMVILIYSAILLICQIIIMILLKKHKNKQKIINRIRIAIFILLIILAALQSLCYYTNYQWEKVSFSDKPPFIQLKDINSISDSEYSNLIKLQRIKNYNNIYTNNKYRSVEDFYPYDEYKQKYDIWGIRIDYFDFRVKDWSKKIIPEMINDSFSKRNSAALDELYCQDTQLGNERIFTIVFCINNITIKMSCIGKADMNTDDIIKYVENWANQSNIVGKCD